MKQTDNPFTKAEIKMLAFELYRLAKDDIMHTIISLNEQVLNTSEAAKVLKCSERQLRRLVAEREVPFSKPDGRLIFYKSQLINYLNCKSRQ